MAKGTGYWLERAEQRVVYNPYGGARNQIGFVVEVLYLIIRLLIIIVKQTGER